MVVMGIVVVVMSVGFMKSFVLLDWWVLFSGKGSLFSVGVFFHKGVYFIRGYFS